jgi:predicted MPP superfamily phosphohydrolase
MYTAVVLIKISYAIDLVNEQNSDMICLPEILSTIQGNAALDRYILKNQHKHGKYSVLGNHDYGEYVTWPTEIEKKKIFNRLKLYTN